jgi:hypothetical protein
VGYPQEHVSKQSNYSYLMGYPQEHVSKQSNYSYLMGYPQEHVSKQSNYNYFICFYIKWKLITIISNCRKKLLLSLWLDVHRYLFLPAAFCRPLDNPRVVVRTSGNDIVRADGEENISLKVRTRTRPKGSLSILILPSLTVTIVFIAWKTSIWHIQYKCTIFFSRNQGT